MVSYKKQIENYKEQYGIEPKPNELCPRFERCQINKCPLHPDYLKLKNDPSDPSQKGKKERCATKDRRMRIAAAFGLKNKGMKEREMSAAKNKRNTPYPFEKIKQGVITHHKPSEIKSQREKKTNDASALCKDEVSGEDRP